MGKIEKRALIVVDVQNDFCEGGALAVPNGDEVVSKINDLLISQLFDLVVFTQDWHPENHCSFAGLGGGWPKHCVMLTNGARLRSGLLTTIPLERVFVYKGIDFDQEAYSGFEGHPSLRRILDEQRIDRVYICGLATDYCVKATALDANKFGFKTSVVIEACRGVDKEKGDVHKAITEMIKAGIEIIEGQVER